MHAARARLRCNFWHPPNRTFTGKEFTSHGCLQAPGAKMLAQGLASNGSLEVLSLAWNGLENEGCIHIAQMFHQNRFLKVRHASP